MEALFLYYVNKIPLPTLLFLPLASELRTFFFPAALYLSFPASPEVTMKWQTAVSIMGLFLTKLANVV
jgi:hypothetical protein